MPKPSGDGKRRCPWCNADVESGAAPAKAPAPAKPSPAPVILPSDDHGESSDEPVLLDDPAVPLAAPAINAVGKTAPPWTFANAPSKRLSPKLNQPSAPQVPVDAPSRGRGAEIVLAAAILLVCSVLAAGGFIAARDWASSGSASGKNDSDDPREESRPSDPREPELAPAPRLAPPLAEKVADFQLPGPLHSAVAGGGGRFVVFHSPAVGKLVIYEPATGRTVRLLDGVDANTLLAAGREKLFLGREMDSRLVRVDLQSGRQEAVAARQNIEQLKHLSCGAAADGPLVIVTRIDASGGRIGMIDPATFKEIRPAISDPRQQLPSQFPLRYTGVGVPRPAVSADGRAFASAGMFMTRDGDPFRVVRPSGIQFLRPSNDGRACFGNGIFDDSGKLIAMGPTDASQAIVYLPAVSGPFFVSVVARRNPDKTVAEVTLNLHAGTDPTPLGELPGSAELTEWAKREQATWLRNLDRHLFVIPGTGRLVVAPAGATAASVYKLDVGELLTRSGRSVHFLSQPPAEVSRGRAFAYSAAAWAANGAATFALDSGPPGMTVSPAGFVSWDVPTTFPGAFAEVRLSARSPDGNVATQVFRLLVDQTTVSANANLNDTAAPVPGERITIVRHNPADGPVIFCGAGDEDFQENGPPGGLLIGFEVALDKFDGIDVVRGFRPIYRVGDKEEFGEKHGERTPYTITVKAKPGYAVGGVTYRGTRWFNTCSLIFMRVAGDRLDPTDQYASEWLGKKRSDPIFQYVTDGTPITGFAGRHSGFWKLTHGFGFVFK